MNKNKNKNKESKDNRNYRIFRVEKAEGKLFPKKITMIRIHAKDDNDAYNQLKDYIKIANKAYKYYVEKWSPTVIIRNGKKFVCNDDNDRFCLFDDEPFFKRIKSKIEISLWSWFVRRPKDVYYWFRDLFYLIKNKQQYHASWCLDNILLDTIAFNIPILKKCKHSLSWAMLEEAYLEKHPELQRKDAKHFFETHFHGYGDDIEKRSVELESKMFDGLVDDINAYKYYMGGYEEINLFGDKNPKALIEIDKKLRHTLPLIKGSYDHYDYIKLNALAEKYWNKIWETVRKYGREFND